MREFLFQFVPAMANHSWNDERVLFSAIRFRIQQVHLFIHLSLNSFDAVFSLWFRCLFSSAAFVQLLLTCINTPHNVSTAVRHFLPVHIAGSNYHLFIIYYYWIWTQNEIADNWLIYCYQLSNNQNEFKTHLSICFTSSGSFIDWRILCERDPNRDSLRFIIANFSWFHFGTL